MSKFGVDIIGELLLYKNSGKQNPILKEYWGHANVKDKRRNDSYFIRLLNQEKLELGAKAEVSFSFLFVDHPNFNMTLSEGQTIELNEGSRKIGELVIHKILNDKLKRLSVEK